MNEIVIFRGCKNLEVYLPLHVLWQTYMHDLDMPIWEQNDWHPK
jgi:hypothetical protein